MRKFLKVFKYLLIVYIGYIIFFGLILLKIQKPKTSNLSYNNNMFHETNNNDVYANIIENINDALDIRLNILNEAKEFINITYLNIISDETGKIFYGKLLEKANEGIKINIIVDGFNLDKDKYFKTVSGHENINYYVYEKTNLLNPQTFNNTLHDKFITIDNNYGILGGRNISNKFLLKDYEGLAHDRDILVYNQNTNIDILKDMNDYYDELISSKYSKIIKYKHKKSIEFDLINNYDKYTIKKDMNEFLNESIKVDNATFVRSPINRGNKEPILFNVINELSKDYDSLTYQTPYITTSKRMLKTFPFNKDLNLTFITNNMNTNPNMPALSNYILNRKKLASKSNLYELQSVNSTHAKSLTIGNDISIIGSLNLDNRSMHLSTESMIVVKSKEFNNELTNIFNSLINNSLKVLENGKYEENENVEVIKEKKFKKAMVKTISFITRLFKEVLTIKKERII